MNGLMIERMAARMSGWLIGLALVVTCALGSTGARAQCASGEYTTGSGGTVRWTYCVSFSSSGIGRLGWYDRVRYLRTIDGPEGELEEIGEGSSEEEGPTARRAVDLARMFLRGELTSAALREHVARCDDPECDHGEVVEGVGDSVSVEGAIGAYGIHLQEHPEDWIAAREFALALLAAKRDSDAVSVLVGAYESDPSIGIVPINPELFGDRPRSLRELVVRAVRHAQRVETGESWMLVSVIMQSEGRTDRALEMLDRAIDRGLDPAIATGLRASLEGSP